MLSTDLKIYLQTQITVLIPCFNNQTYSRNMLSQLNKLGFENIIFLDNNSTDTNMIDFLHAIDNKEAKVIFQGQNLGPRHCVLDADSREFLPQYFCVTDPDLQFNPNLPEDWLLQMIALTEKYQIGKVGFALDISEPELIKKVELNIRGQSFSICEWESQFWQDQLETLNSGDAVYRAHVDTTFAVYNKKYLNLNHEEQFYSAIRVAGKYTCKHLPWYKQSIVSDTELTNYLQTSRVWNNWK